MAAQRPERCKNMILGAFVADAAAMGLHWIYDQPHIRALAPDTPEFMQPSASNYEGVPAYFAHPTRNAGAQSQYGEQALVMLRTLSNAGGAYHAVDYAAQFRAHFGYGGGFVGYIDHATRDTLDNFRRFEDAAKAHAKTLPFSGDADVKSALVKQVLATMARHEGADRAHALETAVSEKHADEYVVNFAMTLLATFETLPPATGAADLQLPAISKLPPLVVALVSNGKAAGDGFVSPVASAIQMTNDHPVAAQYGMICAAMMRAALLDGSIEAVVQAAQNEAGPEARGLIDKALEMRDQDNDKVTKHFGMACDLPFGVPSALHNIATATSFTQAVRRNIYGGGDSCGRAMLVGAVMGAQHGVGGKNGIPSDWIKRLEICAEVEGLLAELFD